MFENLEQLIKIIRERKNSSPDKSYTNKLLKDKKLSVAKVKEEVGELIESVDFYVRKVAFVDSGTLFNGDCTYDDPIIDSDYWETFEGWNMDYSHSTSSFHVYKTTVPIRPISQCGGYGLVEWKFKAYNKKGFQNNINSDAVEFCNGYNNCQYSSIGE